MIHRSSPAEPSNIVPVNSTTSTCGGEASVAASARLWPTFVSVFVAALGSSTVGYAIGFSSSALIDLAALPEDYALQKGSVISDLFAALVMIGAAFGSLIGGLISDSSGRKAALLSAGAPCFVGWLLIAVAQFVTSSVGFKVMLLTGRALTGLSSGIFTAAVPPYAAELSLTKIRGLLGAFYQLSVVIGIFAVYAIAAIPGVTYVHTAIVALVLTLIFETLAMFLNESPRWLLLKGHESKASKVLHWLRRCPKSANEEIQDIKRLTDVYKNEPATNFLLEVRKRQVYLPLILSIILVFFHQFSGINAVISYAAIIFGTAGVQNPKATAAYAVGVLQIVATLISSVLLDVAGRKVLMISGSIGMAISSAVLGAQLYMTRPAFCSGSNMSFVNYSLTPETGPDVCNPQLAALAIVSLIMFVFAFSVGWRALPFIVALELSPQRLRGIIGGISVCVLYSFAAIIIGFYQSYEQAVGSHFTWWTFASISLLGGAYILFFIPETKGKSLEEIESKFKEKSRKTHHRNVSFSIPVKTEPEGLITFTYSKSQEIGRETYV